MLILSFLILLISCSDQVELKKGNQFIEKDGLVTRVHCETERCENKKEWSFQDDELIFALKKRFEFEMNLIEKIKLSHGESSKESFNREREYFQRLLQSDLKKKLREEEQNHFSDKKFESYLYLATDTIIFNRNQKSK